MRVFPKSVKLVIGLSICGLSGYLVYLLLKKDEDDDDDDYSKVFDKTTKLKIVEVPVPVEMVKILIGRNGRNIKHIADQSNTRISVRDMDEGTKCCVIKGSREACGVAENLVRDFLNNQQLLECEDTWIPAKCVAKVIGRDGDRIMEIRSKSGASIAIDSQNKTASTRRCTIRGTKEQIVIAKSLIDEIVEESQTILNKISTTLAKREPRLPAKVCDAPKFDNLKVEQISPIPGQVDSQFEVYVSAMVDPSRFWLQIVGPKATELDVLVDEMSEYYKRGENRENHTVINVNKGDLVAAVFKYDNKWYRAEVLNIFDEDFANKYAELYFVDYGDIDFVPLDGLYELRTDFLRLHFQAIECFLARIDPIGEMWSEDAVDKFEEWTHVGQWKKLSAKINGYSVRAKTRAKREGSPVPGVDLYDVDNDQDLDIAQELVNHGFATFKRDANLKSSSRTTSVGNISVASSS